MSPSLLHILNGDATRYLFEKTGIPGQVLVWREMMVEGELEPSLLKQSFWDKRASFLSGEVEDMEEGKLWEFRDSLWNANLNSFSEIVLWFEYDLFCHVNLLAALAWLKETDVTLPPVSLVCAGEEPGYEGLKGLGELSPEEYPRLFETRVMLSPEDLAFAHKLWLAYTSPTHKMLEELISLPTPAAFRYIVPAFEAHLKRFPNPKTGLTQLEQLALSKVAEAPIAERSLVGWLLRQPTYYGFGDLQYFNMVEKMAPLLKEENALLTLSPLGIEVNKQEASFQPFRKDVPLYGGTRLDTHTWDETHSKLN